MAAMDINTAVATIERFLGTYRAAHPAWAPTETRLNPSGDENNTIKLWFNFGPGVGEDQLSVLEQEFRDALLQAHPEVKGYTLSMRLQAF
jgi:hypothetical protein